MFSLKNKATLYTLAWLLYYSQGLVLPKGTLFGQLLVFVLILVSFYYMYIANTRYRLPVFFIGLNILIFVFTLYGSFLLITYDPAEYMVLREPSIYLKKIYISLLPIYAFFVFFKENLIEEKLLIVWIIIFFVAATGQYIERQRYYVSTYSFKEHTNNVGYVFLSLIPACVFLYKKNILQYVALMYCMFFILMSMKRGSIVISLVCLVFFILRLIKNVTKKKKVLILFLSLILFVVGYVYVQYKMENSYYFQRRIEQTLEGNSSGRDKLYSVFANYFLNEATPLQFAFGSGADATLKVSDNYAHNDWLEIAVNQGVFGIMIYILYWILFAKECLSKSYDPQVKMALQLLFIIYFMKTLFSMSYYDMTIPATFALGYCLSKKNVKDVSRI